MIDVADIILRVFSSFSCNGGDVELDGTAFLHNVLPFLKDYSRLINSQRTFMSDYSFQSVDPLCFFCSSNNRCFTTRTGRYGVGSAE